MTQIFVPQLCQLHLSSGLQRCGGAGVEERWGCQQRDRVNVTDLSLSLSLSLLGGGGQTSELHFSYSLLKFEAHVTTQDYFSVVFLVQLGKCGYITVINRLCPDHGKQLGRRFLQMSAIQVEQIREQLGCKTASLLFFILTLLVSL